jgi:predicted HTH domain antitoxin
MWFFVMVYPDSTEAITDSDQRNFEQRLVSLYQAYQDGRISLSSLAEQLGITTWRTYHLLEDRGWRTANI